MAFYTLRTMPDSDKEDVASRLRFARKMLPSEDPPVANVYPKRMHDPVSRADVDVVRHFHREIRRLKVHPRPTVFQDDAGVAHLSDCEMFFRFGGASGDFRCHCSGALRDPIHYLAYVYRVYTEEEESKLLEYCMGVANRLLYLYFPLPSEERDPSPDLRDSEAPDPDFSSPSEEDDYSYDVAFLRRETRRMGLERFADFVPREGGEWHSSDCFRAPRCECDFVLRFNPAVYLRDVERFLGLSPDDAFFRRQFYHDKKKRQAPRHSESLQRIESLRRALHLLKRCEVVNLAVRSSTGDGAGSYPMVRRGRAHTLFDLESRRLGYFPAIRSSEDKIHTSDCPRSGSDDGRCERCREAFLDPIGYFAKIGVHRVPAADGKEFRLAETEGQVELIEDAKSRIRSLRRIRPPRRIVGEGNMHELYQNWLLDGRWNDATEVKASTLNALKMNSLVREWEVEDKIDVVLGKNGEYHWTDCSESDECGCAENMREEYLEEKYHVRSLNKRNAILDGILRDLDRLEKNLAAEEFQSSISDLVSSVKKLICK